MLMNFGTDYYNTSGVIRLTLTNLILARNHIKVQPSAVLLRNDALCAQNNTIQLLIVQLTQAGTQIVLGELACCLDAPAREYFVGIVTVMMMTAGAHAVFIIMMLMMVLMLVVVVMVMAAGAGLAVVMMMLMLLMLVVVMVVMTAGAGFAVVMMMLMLMFMLVMIVMMMAAGAGFAVMMMVMMMLLMLVQLRSIQQCLVAVCTHDIVNLLAGQLIPRGGDDAGVFAAVLTNQLECLVQTLVAGSAQWCRRFPAD